MLLLKDRMLPGCFYCVTVDSIPPLIVNNQASVGLLALLLARISVFVVYLRHLTPFSCRRYHLHSLEVVSAQYAAGDGFCTAVKSRFIQPESYDGELVLCFILWIGYDTLWQPGLGIYVVLLTQKHSESNPAVDLLKDACYFFLSSHTFVGYCSGFRTSRLL